jgi:hypothetical protein
MRPVEPFMPSAMVDQVQRLCECSRAFEAFPHHSLNSVLRGLPSPPDALGVGPQAMGAGKRTSKGGQDMKATSSSLHAFVSRVATSKRLNFADLRRLERDVLPNGVTSRADAEALIALDAALDRADAGWPSYLVSTVKEFMMRRHGDPTDSAWLAAALSGAAPKTALNVARAVVPALDECDDALRGLAKMTAKRKPKAAACTTGLSSSKIVVPELACQAEPSEVSWTWPGIRLGGVAMTVTLKR